MSPILKVVRPENCIGCDLCALACSKEKKGVLSLEESYLRVGREGREFSITVDIGSCDACGACVKACPRNCLKVEDETQE